MVAAVECGALSLEKLEAMTGETPDAASVVITRKHVCGEPTPQAGHPEPGPVCEECGAALSWIVGGDTKAAVQYRIPDNGRDPQGEAHPSKSLDIP